MVIRRRTVRFVLFARAGLRSLRILIGCVAPALWSLGGCASWHAADADREVHAVLAEYEQRELGNRAEQIRQPTQAPETPTSGPSSEASTQLAVSTDDNSEPNGAVDAVEPLLINLPAALLTAFTSSRDYIDRKEALYLSGLGFTLTRYNFGPILNSTISYLWDDQVNASGGDSLSATLGGRQILPTGGNLSISGTVTGSRGDDPDLFTPPDPAEYSYSSTLQLNLRQPLLRGFGYAISHEALTQGQRNLIYALRSFELFRQDFCIRVTDAFYRLVSQKKQLANDEQNYEDALFDREKTEALRQVDRVREDDVFLARRREIEAEDALLVARTNYDLAVDDFKILLGLPTSTEIEIPDREPDFQPVRIESRSAVEVSLHNRLDLHTLRDRVEDAERQVRIARNRLLPDLDLDVGWSLNNIPSKPYDPTPERWSASVGATLEAPLDRKAERNAYRSSLIGLQQARRDVERNTDEIERDILDQLRQLRQVEKRIILQRDQIVQEQKAVEVMNIRRESGDVNTRDLLDARRGLTNAQNALINLKVQHYVARLRLQRNLGILFIDEEGQWRE